MTMYNHCLFRRRPPPTANDLQCRSLNEWLSHLPINMHEPPNIQQTPTIKNQTILVHVGEGNGTQQPRTQTHLHACTDMAGRCLSVMKLPWCRPEFSQGKCLGEQLNTTSLSLSQFHLSYLPLFFSLQLSNTQTPKEGGEEDSGEGEEASRCSTATLLSLLTAT